MFFVPFGFKFVFFLARLSPEVKINEKMKKSNNLLFQSCKLEKTVYSVLETGWANNLPWGHSPGGATSKDILSIINALNEVADYIPP